MARNATQRNIDDLRDALTPYVDAITGDTDAIIAYYKARANASLNKYLDAEFAMMNVGASAASSYSSSIGSSVQKLTPEKARANRDAAWDEFLSDLAQGGQVLPGANSNLSYWDLSAVVS